MYSLTTLVALGSLGACLDPFLNKAKPFSQEVEDNYNILKYTAWEGPWSQRRGVGLNRDTPTGCRVDQVVMLHRHGERYPSPGDGAAQHIAYQAIVGTKKGELKGSLEFLNWWIPYADGKTAMDNQETTYGAYAGLLGAYWNGVDYRRRYGHLYDGESILPLFSSGYERIASTARKFGQGFLGYNYTDLAAVQIIPETDDQGANTLVGNDCDAVTSSNFTMCPFPSNMTLAQFEKQGGWMLPEFTTAANRLNKENGLNLTATNAYHLMATAAFELNIRGNSPWIQVFTDEEWIAFEYYESTKYFCFYGPGAVSTPYRGSIFLNSTRTLLEQGPEEVGSMFFSFAHDTDITPVVSLLGFASPKSYNPAEITFHSLWDVTDIVPQSGRIVFERLICESSEDLDDDERLLSQLSSKYPLAFSANSSDAVTYANNYTYAGGNITVETLYGNLTLDETHAAAANKTAHKTGTENIYVRVVLNEAVAPIPGCSSGPGKSCKLSEFDKFVDEAIAGYNYYDNCVAPVNKEWPAHVDFFWNWNATNAYNFDPEDIPFQAGLIDYQGLPVSS